MLERLPNTLYKASLNTKLPLIRNFVPLDTSSYPKHIQFSLTIKGSLSLAFDYYGLPAIGTKIALFKLLSTDFNSEDFVSNRKVYSSGVMNARVTRECWILKPVTLEGELFTLDRYSSRAIYLPQESDKAGLLSILRRYFDKRTVSKMSKYSAYDILNRCMYNYTTKSLLEVTRILNQIADELGIQVMYKIFNHDLQPI